jgi:hypothetical protein
MMIFPPTPMCVQPPTQIKKIIGVIAPLAHSFFRVPLLFQVSPLFQIEQLLV